MSKSQTEEAVERTLEFILSSETREFFHFANDLKDFYSFSQKTDDFFKIRYSNYHKVLGEICFKDPNCLHDKLVKSLIKELTYIHSLIDVFKLVLCLKYLGADVESSLSRYVNSDKFNKINCALKLIEATSDEDGYVPPRKFQCIYGALKCIDK